MLERSHGTYIIRSHSGRVEIRSWQMQPPSTVLISPPAQADLVLFHFADTAFFYRLKVCCGNPASSHSVSTILPPAFAHFMPLCHILLILEIHQTFYQEKDDESLKSQMMVSILSNKAFFNWASLVAQW